MTEESRIMQKRLLGRTGLRVSCIGLGGMGVISQNHSSREQAKEVVHTAIDRGVNFIDTARGYFDSEEIIGEVLQERKETIYIASKTYQRTAKRAEKEFGESLQRLKVKKIDLYQIHHLQYMEELEKVKGPGGALEALNSYRKQGLIDFIGVSSHNPKLLPNILESGFFDTVQFPFSVVEREHYKTITQTAAKYNLGTIVMKPLAGGNITSVETALKFILSHNISTVIPGCTTVEHVITDTNAGINFHELTNEEKEQIIAKAEKLPDKFCRRCRYCERVCSKNLPISDIFRCEDYLILNATYARDQYKSLNRTALECMGCGKCEKICPYHLPVREKLRIAHRRLTRGKIEDLAVKFFRKIGIYDVVRKIYFDVIGKVPKR